MWGKLASVSVALFLVGCAPTVLFDRSSKYSYTFSDLEDRVILENLARYIDDENRIPSLVDFKQGSVQATDNLSLGATVPYTTGLSGGNKVLNPQVFNLGAAQIQSQDNWTYVPVTDVQDLGKTRCLYRFVIEQSLEPRTTTWDKFNKGCSAGGKALLFPYSPPSQPWLWWRPADGSEPSLANHPTDPTGEKYEFLGVYNSYALWGKKASFHDFELAILGSIPNTAGAASTSPAGGAGGLALSILSNKPSPAFKAAEQTLKFTYRVRNTGNATLQQITITSTKVHAVQCEAESLAVNEQTECSGTYQTTKDDLSCFDDLATAVGQGDVANAAEGSKAGQLVSAVVKTKYCVDKPPIITQRSRPTPAAPSIQFFVPGKSSGTIVPPMAAPAQ